MPIVHIYLFEGRSKEQKRRIAEKITRVFEEELRIPPEEVIILFHDLPRVNYAKGGVLAEL